MKINVPSARLAILYYGGILSFVDLSFATTDETVYDSLLPDKNFESGATENNDISTPASVSSIKSASIHHNLRTTTPYVHATTDHQYFEETSADDGEEGEDNMDISLGEMNTLPSLVLGHNFIGTDDKQSDSMKVGMPEFEVPTISTLADTNYDPSSWNSQCRSLNFRHDFTSDGKVSRINYISVYGGGWNKVHKELTSRSLNDGESFAIIGNKLQIGVGLCIDSCDLETKFGLRWVYNCVGFYGDGPDMHAADKNNKEYFVKVDRSKSTYNKITYDEGNNCVKHAGSRSGACTPLPPHFKGKRVRAIGQVWNSAYARLTS